MRPELKGRSNCWWCPLGFTEQRGPHLTIGTDTDIATGLADLIRAAAGIAVAPPLSYGAGGEHQSFPKTLSVGHVATELLLVELGRSATHTFPPDGRRGRRSPVR